MVPVYFGPRSLPADNEMVGNFVSGLVWGRPGEIRDYCSMGVFEDGKLVGGTLFHNWHPESGVIELTSAATNPRWLARNVIKAMFDLPFGRLDCQMCVLRVSARNERMVRIARKFGFSEYLIPRLRGRDENEFIFTLTDDQWAASPFNRGA